MTFRAVREEITAGPSGAWNQRCPQLIMTTTTGKNFSPLGVRRQLTRSGRVGLGSVSTAPRRTNRPLGATGGVLLVNTLDHLERTDGELAPLTIPGGLGLGAAAVVQ